MVAPHKGKGNARSPALYHPLHIGNVTLQGNLLLAPLAGYTDQGMRKVALLHGANYTYTEMVSAEAIARGNEKTCHMMQRTDGETQLGVQIFLSDPEQAERALPYILQHNPTTIDINCGCPVPKVVKNGCGSALMQHPKKLAKIITTLRQRATPITVKIRLGIDNNSINYLEVAQAAEEAGAAMIAMHARTQKEGYSGTAHWEHLARLKEVVHVPVIGSGDLFSAQAGKSMLEQTGIDGLLFARGAMGNPFIFKQTRHLLTTGNLLPEPTKQERLEAAHIQLKKAIEEKGEHRACREMRKQSCTYIRDLPGSRWFRRTIVHASTLAEYESIFSQFLEGKTDE